MGSTKTTFYTRLFDSLLFKYTWVVAVTCTGLANPLATEGPGFGSQRHSASSLNLKYVKPDFGITKIKQS
jgi:hypothetical protein